jgi:23S rRNA pseudouridine1911/1915/1917 synthase
MTDSKNEMNAGWSLVVDPSSNGLRLDRFLALRIPRLSRARASRLTVTDLDCPTKVLKKSCSVQNGQRLWVGRPVPDAHVEPPAPSVLYEDDDILVLDKPPGLAVHPTATRFKATVTWWLAMHRPGIKVEPAHRLDLETSGVLVCSKSIKVDRILKAAFATSKIEKRYIALVSEPPLEKRWTVSTPLGFDGSSRVRIKMGPGNLPAQTDFEVLERWPGLTMVEAIPKTGRQHQIRVHLAMAGFPILGDKLYGPDESLFLAHLDRDLEPEEFDLLGHHRLALHATEISLNLDGRGMTFQAPFPSDLSKFLSN